MIRKIKSGKYRLYSRKKDAKTGKRRNLGTFSSLAAAKKHERAVQFFKRGKGRILRNFGPFVTRRGTSQLRLVTDGLLRKTARLYFFYKLKTPL